MPIPFNNTYSHNNIIVYKEFNLLMKTRIHFLLIILCLFSFHLSRAKVNTIVVDPGHGGSDQGAVRGDLKEAKLCLSIAKELAELLKSKKNYKVFMTRESDKHLSLVERVDFSKDHNSDLFISIHANSSEDPKAQGLEIYFQNQMAPDEESLFLANAENEISEETSRKTSESKSLSDVSNIVEDLKRGVRIQKSFRLGESVLKSIPRSSIAKYRGHALRQAPFFVVLQNQSPSILIEVGFLTNTNDKTKLMSQEYHKSLAQAIFEGIESYLNNN